MATRLVGLGRSAQGALRVPTAGLERYRGRNGRREGGGSALGRPSPGGVGQAKQAKPQLRPGAPVCCC